MPQIGLNRILVTIWASEIIPGVLWILMKGLAGCIKRSFDHGSHKPQAQLLFFCRLEVHKFHLCTCRLSVLDETYFAPFEAPGFQQPTWPMGCSESATCGGDLIVIHTSSFGCYFQAASLEGLQALGFGMRISGQISHYPSACSTSGPMSAQVCCAPTTSHRIP